MAGTSEKEQRTVMGLEAAVRVEAEFPTRPWRGTGVGEDPRGQGRATLAKEEGEGKDLRVNKYSFWVAKREGQAC